MGELAGLITACGLFGWIPIMVYFKHKIRLEEIKARSGGGDDPALAQAVHDLRREVQELRENTTKFDMSFDAALTRLENRMDRSEVRTGAISTDDVVTTVSQGR